MNRDELREALAEVVDLALGDYRPIYNEAGQCVDSAAADALLAGPVGDLLAENERLRSKVADLRDIAVDAGVERDQALATLKAVREYVADVRNPLKGRRRFLLDILDATDGGERRYLIQDAELQLPVMSSTAVATNDVAEFDRALAAHDAQVRADEREKIAQAIEGLEKPSGPIDRIAVWLLAIAEAARIARSGGGEG